MYIIVAVLVLYSTAEIKNTEANAEPATKSPGKTSSVCYGTTSNGRLENGVKIPSSGANFESYSQLAGILGRTYVHSTVRDIILDAYSVLETTQPGKLYKFAESGFEDGGEFSPHKTHRNGLSVDFMVPVIDSNGQSVLLPTHAFNKWGYAIEFDTKGKVDDLSMDFTAMAAHIVALDQAARKKGVGLWRVIFDPELQPNLLKTEFGPYLKKHIQFSTRKSWVRHDEHYHVDFQIECQKM